MTERFRIATHNEYHKRRSLRVDVDDWLSVVIPDCGKDITMSPQTLLDAYDLWSRYKAGDIAVMTRGEYEYAISCIKGDSLFIKDVLNERNNG